METKENHSTSYVAIAIVLAIIVLGWCISVFLSSRAEAAYGVPSNSLSLFDINPVERPYLSSSRVSALVWQLQRSPFEKTHPSIRYVVSWPELPTVAEAHIRMATVRLAAFMAEQAQELDAKAEAKGIEEDLEGLRKAIAVAFMLSGFCIIVVYGWPTRLEKNTANKIPV